MFKIRLKAARFTSAALCLLQSIAVGAMTLGMPWLAAGDFFPSLTQAEPRTAEAWRAAGIEHLRLRRFAAAIAALQRSLSLQPDSPRSLYSLGVAYAGLGDADHAFEWLERARSSHRYDMTEMTE